MFAASGGAWRVVLVDSTVWIDLLRKRESAAVRRLRNLLALGEAAVAPVIVQEILQGAANRSAFEKLRKYFSSLPLVGTDRIAERHIAAADLYARARWRAITPRSPNDCLVAVTAIEENMPLLHDDIDFEQLAVAEPKLKLVPRT